MIQTRFEELRLKEARKRNATRLPLQQIADETGLSFGTLQRLSTNTNTRIDYSTLDALCLYFKCRVGDLLEHVPDAVSNTAD